MLTMSTDIFKPVMDTILRSHDKEPIQDLHESYTIHTKAMYLHL